MRKCLPFFGITVSKAFGERIALYFQLSYLQKIFELITVRLPTPLEVKHKLH